MPRGRTTILGLVQVRVARVWPAIMAVGVLLAGRTAPAGPTPSPAAEAVRASASVGAEVLPFGDAPTGIGTLPAGLPAVAMVATPDGGGFWAVSSAGAVGRTGDATSLGGLGFRPVQPIVGMAATADGGGYWLVASDGGIFGFGDARFFGSAGGLRLNRPIVGMAATADGGGYWLVASDGGIFGFGDARFFGSAGGLRLNRPIVGMAATADGGGYWLVASDGGIFGFGDARFFGSAGGLRLNRPIVGMAATADGGGYWLVASDGGIFGFGDARFFGSASSSLAGRVAAGVASSPTGRGYSVLAVPAGVRVGFAGDVNGIGRVGTVLAGGGNPLAGMEPVIGADDATMVNLETAVGTLGTPMDKEYTFHSPPSLLAALKAAGVTVVNLANNHSLDFGSTSLMETIDDAHAAGLLTVGAGANAAAAYAPAIVDTPGGTVAFLGLSQVVPAGWAATAANPGIASAYDVSASVNAIRAALRRGRPRGCDAALGHPGQSLPHGCRRVTGRDPCPGRRRRHRRWASARPARHRARWPRPGRLQPRRLRMVRRQPPGEPHRTPERGPWSRGRHRLQLPTRPYRPHRKSPASGRFRCRRSPRLRRVPGTGGGNLLLTPGHGGCAGAWYPGPVLDRYDTASLLRRGGQAVVPPMSDVEAPLPPEVSKRAVVLAVARRGGPKILEATIIPGLLFYACLMWGGFGLAYLTAVAWIYGCLLRRLAQRKTVPAVLILGAIGISVRTAIAVASGSSFVYFVQPIVGTVATGGVFLASLVVGRPLIGRLAGDFWPITPEMAKNPRIESLFRKLTLLWGGVNLATAAMTFVLLLCLPLATFVAIKQVSGLGITVSAIALTIVWSHRTACGEGIVTAPRPRAALAR